MSNPPDATGRRPKLLVANRAEIACRILRAGAELGLPTVSVAPADDIGCRHTRLADTFVELDGRGSVAYLDIDQLVAVASAHDCTLVHPGYGFLAENAAFAAGVEAAGLTFVGPTPDTIARFGDKADARALAGGLGVPTLAGSGILPDGAAATAFVAEHGPVMLKAVAGGGGRGMRAVTDPGDAAAAFDRCSSEALAAFGNGDVYAEQLVSDARHVEVQIIGDGSGRVVHLWERECTLQRQNQKLVELAPAPGLAVDVRDALLSHAVALGSEVDYRSLGTVEFLVDRATGAHHFIEVNTRIQVEHTVTEEITGVDLVRTQLLVALGNSLTDEGLHQPPRPTGQAIQLRINTEAMQADGTARPTGGTLTRFAIPSGRGVRTDTHGYAGYTPSPTYDSLLAKVIVHVPEVNLFDAYRRAALALAEFDIAGIATNKAFLRALIARPEVMTNDVSTRYVTVNADQLVAEAAAYDSDADSIPAGGESAHEIASEAEGVDPGEEIHDGHAVVAPLQGTIVAVDVDAGEEVAPGTQLVVIEAMKMEHAVIAPTGGIVTAVTVAVGDLVFEGHRLLTVEPADVGPATTETVDEVDLDHIRPDLAESIERHGYGLDENRPDAVAKRHATGRRTARENLADLVDEGSFTEWGPLVVAAQRRRRPKQELIEKTPGDGLIGGIGTVNAELFGHDTNADTQTMVVSYDYMVLAGTQGHNNHRKKDRLFDLAARLRTPVVLFAEGGGGRPGDTDGTVVAGLDGPAFTRWAQLSGTVPLVGIVGGYCFAGNAALLGCCDVIIATRHANIGMGGPAMIEGGGLGVFHPTEVGPVEVQEPNGVIDILVDDEAAAVAVAKQYLSYFQGRLATWETHDQRRLRHLIPENRLRIYDVRQVIETTFDVGSVLELRPAFGLGMITALARIEGHPVGVIANNQVHLAGAIDADGADKASRFMQLCDTFGLPIVSFCDTPGIMVGPEAEKTALVRRASRMFVVGANLEVPLGTIVLRKGYGLGAQAMAGGDFKAGVFTVGWPTSEFGGMGLEGFVKLGYRNELAAIDDPAERMAEFEARVAKLYEAGKGVSLADHFEIDDVIDPLDTRRWIMMMVSTT
ncbi:MAG: carbamoyl-phosphate synthase large subunit [Acidimicrobiia bacterium]|nr:carbamoyl-phosphate synthase large subunit [Acidimicrobiia bacterium]